MKNIFEKFKNQPISKRLEKNPVALDLLNESSPKQESSSKKESMKSPLTKPEEEVVLETRERIDSKNLGGGCNVTLLVGLKDNGSGVFKPKSGERENLRERVPALSFFKRERAAYLVSRFFGFDLVPTTTIRELDGEEGSIQEFIPDAQLGYEVSQPFSKAIEPELIKLWIFDYIIYNSDRHGGNFLVRGDKLYAIDNGLTFGADYLRFFRNFFDQPLSEEMIRKIENFISWQDGREILRDLLLELLPFDEVEACFKRVEKISQLIKRGKGNSILSADASQLTFS